MKSRLKTLVSMVVLIALAFGVGYYAGNHPEEATTPAPVAAQSGPPNPNDEFFLPFFEAWELLHTFYVDDLDDEALLEGSLQGLMTSIGDRNMDYIPPDNYSRVLESLNASFEGIGATVQKDEDTGGLLIVRPLPGSPAEGAGIRAGDIVITVDGQDITEMEQDVIISMVRGPEGTEVILGVKRGLSNELLEFTITRARITLPTVDYTILDGNIVYIQMFSFSQETANQLEQILIETDTDNLNGVILDLRGNGGGYLDVALRVISEFVPEGVILIEKSRDSQEIHEADGNVLAPNVPVVVLIDEGSASGSELVAGAFQDLGRATVIGMTSYGKGTVQTWRSLSNGGGVRISIARWYTPEGRSIDLVGITPDYMVEFPPLAEDEEYSRDTDPQLQAALEFLEAGEITTIPLFEPTPEPAE